MGRPRTAIRIEDRVKNLVTNETGIAVFLAKGTDRVQVMPDAGRKRYIWWRGEEVDRLGPPTRECTRCGEEGHNALHCPLVEDPNAMEDCQPCTQDQHLYCSGRLTTCACSSERNHGRGY